MEVPDLMRYDIEANKVDLDFELIQSVLIDERKFSRLSKSIKELKKEVDGGVQLGLFG